MPYGKLKSTVSSDFLRYKYFPLLYIRFFSWGQKSIIKIAKVQSIFFVESVSEIVSLYALYVFLAKLIIRVEQGGGVGGL